MWACVDKYLSSAPEPSAQVLNTQVPSMYVSYSYKPSANEKSANVVTAHAPSEKEPITHGPKQGCIW